MLRHASMAQGYRIYEEGLKMVAADFDYVTTGDGKVITKDEPVFEQPPTKVEQEDVEWMATINLVAMRPTAVGERVYVRFKTMLVKEQVTVFYADKQGKLTKFIQPHASMMNMKIDPTVKELR